MSESGSMGEAGRTGRISEEEAKQGKGNDESKVKEAISVGLGYKGVDL